MWAELTPKFMPNEAYYISIDPDPGTFNRSLTHITYITQLAI